MRYMTTAEYAEAYKNWLKLAKEFEHERRIVRSIPEKKIGTGIKPTCCDEKLMPG